MSEGAESAGGQAVTGTLADPQSGGILALSQVSIDQYGNATVTIPGYGDITFDSFVVCPVGSIDPRGRGIPDPNCQIDVSVTYGPDGEGAWTVQSQWSGDFDWSDSSRGLSEAGPQSGWSKLTITDRSDIAAGDFDIAFSGESDEQRGGTWNCGDPPTDDSCHNDPPTSTTYQPEGSYVAECTTTTQMDETNHYFDTSTNSSGGTDYSYAFTDTDAWNDATEARVTVVGLTAYRTGDNYGTAVSAGDQQSGDPSNYVILTNNGYTEDPQGLLDDMDYNEQQIQQQGGIGTAGIANTSLAKITLKQVPQAIDSNGNTVDGGYVTIGLSNSSEVRIYDDQGNVLWDGATGEDDGLSADLSGSSYLAGLAGGDVTIYVEGLSADSDFSLTYNYSAPAGSITPASTSIHMAIADIEVVDNQGNALSEVPASATSDDIAGVLNDYAEAGSSDPATSAAGQAAVYSDMQWLQSVEFKPQIQGANTSEITNITLSSPGGGSWTSPSLVDTNGGVETPQFCLLYTTPEGSTPLTDAQIQQFENIFDVTLIDPPGGPDNSMQADFQAKSDGQSTSLPTTQPSKVNVLIAPGYTDILLTKPIRGETEVWWHLDKDPKDGSWSLSVDVVIRLNTNQITWEIGHNGKDSVGQPITLAGVYGHEQRHAALLQKYIASDTKLDEILSTYNIKTDSETLSSKITKELTGIFTKYSVHEDITHPESEGYPVDKKDYPPQPELNGGPTEYPPLVSEPTWCVIRHPNIVEAKSVR